jgi:hypothetical protein
MSELRALIRLCRATPSDQRDARRRELRAVVGTFSEGFETADLREAGEVLATP